MIRTRISLAMLAACLLGLAAAGPLDAQGTQGRVQLTITDMEGKPLEGVKATVTSPEFSYKQEKTSDTKGQLTLMILDASRDYEILLEKEGYEPFKQGFDPAIGGTTRREYRLQPTAPAEEAAPALSEAATTFNEGVAAFNAGDKATALARFEKAAQLDPNLIQAHSALSGLYLDQKKYAEAAAAAEKVLAAEPGNVSALRDRYEAYKGAGDKAKAAAALEALTAGDKSRDTAVIAYNEGVGLFNAGNMAEAKAQFERALSVDSTLAKAHYLLGLISINLEDQAQAREHLQKFLQLAPDDKDAATAKEMLESLK